MLKKTGLPHQVRIIAGRFRGRRLTVLDQKGLRPTSNRLRETLFNWLAPVIHGTSCLDAFAGAGALGFEALSRGARFVTFLDCSSAVVTQLKSHAQQFGLSAAEADVRRLSFPPSQLIEGAPFDVVFLDPPFDMPDVVSVCSFLGAGWLSSDAWVYLELSTEGSLPAVPENWCLHRQAQVGRVLGCLFHVMQNDCIP